MWLCYTKNLLSWWVVVLKIILYSDSFVKSCSELEMLNACLVYARLCFDL